MKEYYLATYKKTDGTYGTVLVLSDSEAKAEETIWLQSESQPRTKYITIAVRGVRLWSFEQQNKQTKAGVSDRNVRLTLLLFYFLFGFIVSLLQWLSDVPTVLISSV